MRGEAQGAPIRTTCADSRSSKRCDEQSGQQIERQHAAPDVNVEQEAHHHAQDRDSELLELRPVAACIGERTAEIAWFFVSARAVASARTSRCRARRVRRY